jgi:hypothetical protein
LICFVCRWRLPKIISNKLRFSFFLEGCERKFKT